MSILLSIIVPVYNRQTGIVKLLNSLVNSVDFQLYKNIIEIIIIDDASSTDVTLPYYPITHLTLIRNSKNYGAPISRKKGFKLSQGNFVHFHDSDDAFSEQWLAGIIKKLTHYLYIDILLTARYDINEKNVSQYRVQKYFHKNNNRIDKIKKRLLYRNCMGPLGGVTFSRKVMMHISFKNLASCQDWQMYLDAIPYSKVLVSCPEITYTFFTGGEDRISHNSLKKILGFLQLSQTTAKESIFAKNIRLFYLYTCKSHILKKKGVVNNFYNKHYFIILLNFILITLYLRLF